MKKTRKKAKKAKKQITWRNKLKNCWVWTKDKSVHLWDKLMGTAFDYEFPLAFGMVLTGGAILAGCLNPWTVIGLLGVLVGGHKLYHIFKFQ